MYTFNDIYETMLGLREEGFQVPGVEDAFAEGSECALNYDAMRGNYQAVCTLLEVEESIELDKMVEAMEAIQWELCRRCYCLGFHHGRK